MARNRFVTAVDPVRLSLTDGDWIEVKPQLTYGEAQELTSSLTTSMVVGSKDREDGEAEVGMDTKRHSIKRLELWLVDWSFKDEHDKPVTLSRSAIENMDEETGLEVTKAIEEYIAARDAKREAAAKPASISALKPATRS